MGTLDGVELRFQHPALVLHLLVMCNGRRLVKLNDHINGGTVMAVFQSLKIFGQFVLPISKGEASRKQAEQQCQ